MTLHIHLTGQPGALTGTTKGKSLRRPTLGQVARGNRLALVGLK